jgi:glycosyltransferase involved in cell wall biosynthesis
MIYILTAPKSSGGILTWTKLFTEYLNSKNLKYTIINDENAYKINFGKNNLLIINNYLENSFYEVPILELLKNDNNKIYFVIHSTICPSNSVVNKFSKYIDGFICVSDEVVIKMKKLFPTKLLFTLYNYIPKKEKIQVTSNGKFNIGFVGRFAPEKNLPMLLYAIKDFDSSILLHIFGGSQNENYVKFIHAIVKKLKIEDKVIFHGIVTVQKEIYEKCNCIIIPSIYEGVPYCMLEALTYGIPVIVQDIKGISKYIKDYGFLFKYDGFNESDYENDMTIGSYQDMLLKIGYIKTLIFLNGTLSKDVLECIGMLIRKTHDKIILPPFTVNNTITMFERNTEILKNVILQAKEKKISFEPIEPISKTDFDKQISTILDDIKKYSN